MQGEVTVTLFTVFQVQQATHPLSQRVQAPRFSWFGRYDCFGRENQSPRAKSGHWFQGLSSIEQTKQSCGKHCWGWNKAHLAVAV